MIDGQIITEDRGYADHVDVENDILKMAVVERHRNTGHIGIGYLHGYGLTEGAVATSVSHDSHNIICVGCSDEDMAFAVNRIAENKGGIVVVKNGAVIAELPLEIAGLMSSKPLVEVNDLLENAKAAAYGLGIRKDVDPFMTLSFMSLPVIPSLRLTTRGVIDVVTQQYV
jgi:adenine deaminase